MYACKNDIIATTAQTGVGVRSQKIVQQLLDG